MRIQLLHFPGCPNVEPAREVLRAAVAAVGVVVAVEEIDTTADSTPAALRGWGSPTILVNGVDVAGEEPTAGSACRVYAHEGRMTGAPSEAMVSAALRTAR